MLPQVVLLLVQLAEFCQGLSSEVCPFYWSCMIYPVIRIDLIGSTDGVPVCLVLYDFLSNLSCRKGPF
jgi:hypothetical protein